MTSTDVLTLGRRQQAGAASRSGVGRHRRRASLRGLLVLPVALLLAAAPAAPALAANANSEGLSTYKHTETAKKETLPSKSEKTPTTPAKAVEPATTTSQTTTPKASTLPFTGFDLSWTVGFGLLLVGAGGSIVLMQRRERRGDSR
jgi:hypothetical protein